MDVTTCVITNYNIDEIFAHPKDYVDSDFDLPLTEIYGNGEKLFIVMIGITEGGVSYITVEDDYIAEDYYQNDNESMWDIYETAVDDWLERIKE